MKKSKYLVDHKISVVNCLIKLDGLASDDTLFVVDEQHTLLGSITDGDMRRGLIDGLTINNEILEYANKSPKYVMESDLDILKLVYWRDERKINLIPIVNENRQIVEILNFKNLRSKLPIDAVIMAGGKGVRLRPLTENTPKPLLKIGDKPIIEYNVDRLKLFGLKNLYISINYLGEQLKEYFGDGADRALDVGYICEDKPLGTIGSLSLVPSFENEYILVMNSDLLTNLDYEKMFIKFLNESADMIIATVPYQVEVPYGVFELENNLVSGIKEKPTYTYYSNGGIYVFKKEMLKYIPEGSYFDATDFIETLINNGKRVVQYPIHGYWLDIGKHDDFKKAEREIHSIDFS